MPKIGAASVSAPTSRPEASICSGRPASATSKEWRGSGRSGSYLSDPRTTSWMKISNSSYSQMEERHELFRPAPLLRSLQRPARLNSFQEAVIRGPQAVVRNARHGIPATSRRCQFMLQRRHRVQPDNGL